ncbi:multi protein bridging factor 1-domain-containing protein [Pyronema domesticum]|uniref:Multiprotein-bridging factor 1 n=1 Tax=Pyronema omphalodes (strain CBS 100304) TaxID=1076935 RepID=U4KZD7_PYROM|nr:multi protein bridging factor 1-domain-containing protein [Pyronema domesticum]CCX07060.1 Similar to Multiprotein-bridging factor 1; acc. no. Q752P7 [Pyronema omphalodes CBS 100304]
MSATGWDDKTVIGRNVRPGGAARPTVARTQAEINAARRSGAIVATDKKYATGNQVQSTDGQRLTKIDRENEVAPPKTIDKEVGKAMSKARGEKTPPMTQKDLATKVNEKPSVINDYESGRAVPNQQVLAKLERALGVKLRGKDIGSPLGPKGAKK